MDLFVLSKKMKMCVNVYCFAATSIISEISNVLLKHSGALITSPHYDLASFEYLIFFNLFIYFFAQILLSRCTGHSILFFFFVNLSGNTNKLLSFVFVSACGILFTIY